MIQWYADATLKIEPAMTLLQVIHSANICPNMYKLNNLSLQGLRYLTGYRLITDYIIAT